MRIYLVQDSSCLGGSGGYSYGLLRGGHKHLLVSFAKYMENPNAKLANRPDMYRRKLANRRDKPKEPK